MLTQLNRWISGNASGGCEEQKLREISLEYQEAELVSATQNFDPCRRLGSGNYGCVYRATLKDGHEVAIKVIEVDEEDTSGFADEVLVLSKFRHPNLVTLMGWGSGLDEDGCGRRYLVYELLEGGDVAGRLAKARGKNGTVTPFSWMERLWVALDAACGLSHMHNSTPKAFHRDIKSANILLDRSGTAKMADFGLSGIAKNKNKLNMTCDQISGTPGYACPHYIKTGKVTEQTEVYAYGMVVMEMLLNSMPACMGQNGTIMYPIFQIVMPQAEGALQRATAAADAKAEWPPPVARDVAELSLVCSEHEERKRPHFTDVGKRLRELCQQHCGGKRPSPAGSWQPSAVTHPQMGLAAASSSMPGPGPGQGAATNPQMGVGGQGAATNPQMGVAGLGPGQAAATNPQMGVGGIDHTVPQSYESKGWEQASPATKPQMGLTGAGGGGGGGDMATKPQLGLGPAAGGASAGSFLEMLGRVFTGSESKEAELAEVLLECTHSGGTDVSQMPLKHKCLALRAGEQPWAIGRQQQPNFFAQLIPDEATRTLISRSHVVLSLENQAVKVRKLSPNLVKLNGWPINKDDEVPLTSGAQMDFCGRDNATPILSFSVVLRGLRSEQTSAPTKLDLVQATSGKSDTEGRPPGFPRSAWWFCGDPGPHSLLCVSAIGASVSQMPTEARVVPLRGKLMLGRMHQSGLFEHLLSNETAQRYLCCVSRSHLEIVPKGGGEFEVTNQSANPIAISGPKLGKGEAAILRPGSCIDFIGTHSDGSGQTVVYLKLQLQEQPRVQRNTSQGSEKPPTEPLLEALGGAEQKRLLPAFEDARAKAPFWLQLGGTAVRQGFSEEQRLLEGTPQGLMVGRVHQQALHQEALRKEVREYLSRDHFRIGRDGDGRYHLVALSSNPIWRDRKGQRRELEKGDPPLSLLHGDEILLFTGAADCTPDGPENLGTLKWRFFQADNSRDPIVDNDTVRNVGRPKPRDRSPANGRPQHYLAGSLVGKNAYKEKNRYTCLGQVFDTLMEDPSAGYRRKSKSPSRVTFAGEDKGDKPSGIQRPATGYIRQVPPEVHELCGPDGRPLD